MVWGLMLSKDVVSYDLASGVGGVTFSRITFSSSIEMKFGM